MLLGDVDTKMLIPYNNLGTKIKYRILSMTVNKYILPVIECPSLRLFFFPEEEIVEVEREEDIVGFIWYS